MVTLNIVYLQIHRNIHSELSKNDSCNDNDKVTKNQIFEQFVCQKEKK